MTLDQLIDALVEILPEATANIDVETGEICIFTDLKIGPNGNDLISLTNKTEVEIDADLGARTNHYFAEDGNYGDATGILVVDTTNWLGRDWVQIEDSTDSTRLTTARAIHNKNSK